MQNINSLNGASVAAVSPRELKLIFAGLFLSMILAALDQSIVNTALPSMASDLGGLAHLSWVVTAFMLSSTIVTPIYGKLGDMFGRRPLLLVSISLFIAASALCGVAQSMGQLIAFRFLQGLGAGGLMTLSQTVISDVVSPRQRARYQGIFTGAFALAAVAGPLVGGGLTTALSWHWVFYVNVPIGLLALALILVGLRPQMHQNVKKHQIDFAGALLLSIAAGAALLLFSWAGSEFAWQSVKAAGLALLALVMLALFLWREKTAAEPMIDLRLFRIPAFTIGAFTTGCMSFAMMSAMVFLPLYFQLVLGRNPAEAGFLLLPQIAAMLVSSIFGGRLSSALGKPKLFMVGGICLEAAGLTGLAVMAWQGMALPWFMAALAVLGFGMGVAMPNATVIIQSSVPRANLGVATSSMAFIRSLGGALGVALSGGAMASTLIAHLGDLGSQLDAHAIISGGMQMISTLDPQMQSAVAAAFRQSIAVSFMIGGGVMTLAIIMAATLKGTDFDN